MIVVLLISIAISARKKNETVIMDSYSVEIIDSLFFEQIDSLIMSQIGEHDSKKIYRIMVIKKNGKDAFSLSLEKTDTLEISIIEVDTPKHESYYNLEYNNHRYSIEKETNGIFVKKKKRIKVTAVKKNGLFVLTLSDLFHRAWCIRWINNEPIQFVESYDNRVKK
ncbi:MAG: hypothetical protein IJY31_04890 [Muribaculaceae bacterium]|nr:hypothetical protein [Muribaculaceae bacterium]